MSFLDAVNCLFLHKLKIIAVTFAFVTFGFFVPINQEVIHSNKIDLSVSRDFAKDLDQLEKIYLSVVADKPFLTYRLNSILSIPFDDMLLDDQVVYDQDEGIIHLEISSAKSMKDVAVFDKILEHFSSQLVSEILIDITQKLRNLDHEVTIIDINIANSKRKFNTKKIFENEERISSLKYTKRLAEMLNLKSPYLENVSSNSFPELFLGYEVLDKMIKEHEKIDYSEKLLNISDRFSLLELTYQKTQKENQINDLKRLKSNFKENINKKIFSIESNKESIETLTSKFGRKIILLIFGLMGLVISFLFSFVLCNKNKS